MQKEEASQMNHGAESEPFFATFLGKSEGVRSTLHSAMKFPSHPGPLAANYNPSELSRDSRQKLPSTPHALVESLSSCQTNPFPGFFLPGIGILKYEECGFSFASSAA